MLKVHRIVNVIFNSNTYILYLDESDSCYLIDPGNTKEILCWMEENNKKRIKGIFVTHSHFDHINSINDFLLQCDSIPVYVSANEGANIISNDRKNASRYHETSYVVDKDRCISVCGGDVISLWNKEKLIVYETPGHSPDSLSFFCNNFLFTGDALIPNVKVITKIRGGDKEAARKSIELLYSIMNNQTVLCPGHEAIIPFSKLNLNYEYL